MTTYFSLPWAYNGSGYSATVTYTAGVPDSYYLVGSQGTIINHARSVEVDASLVTVSPSLTMAGMTIVIPAGKVSTHRIPDNASIARMDGGLPPEQVTITFYTTPQPYWR